MDPEIEVECDWCPMRDVLDRIGEKWTALILLNLQNGTRRYTALRLSLGHISQKVLTTRLRGMERDGLVRRRVYDTTPITTDYSLTPVGRDLARNMQQLRTWAYGNGASIMAARTAYDAR